MAIGYVTNYGNIENDGLSWSTPLRSLQSIFDLLGPGTSLENKFFKGFFREKLNILGLYGHIYGTSPEESVIDGTLLSGAFRTQNHGCKNMNFTIQNFELLTHSQNSNGYFENLIIKNVINCGIIAGSLADTLLLNTNSLTLGTSGVNMIFNKNTIVNSIITFPLIKNQNSNLLHSNVISLSSLHFSSQSYGKFLAFSLFHNCMFKFTGGGLGSDEANFEAPQGSNDTEKLENIRQRMANVYGGLASQYLPNCRYQTDGDLFINPAKENFYLVPGCLANRMSYDAQFVGKYPEGSLADFTANFVSYTNIDALGNIIDQTVDANAETAILDLGKLRHINSFAALGERAARNGNQVNVVADLGAAINPGTNLTDGKTYIVKTEAISQTASGKTRDVGETFIAKNADGLAFTSATGYVQEVYLDKPRTIELKASKTDVSLSSAPWIKMDLCAEPRVNYDVNGQIQYGNADAGYDEATSERLFIRYWKARITIKAKNLPS
ncbi:MAG: hypothetical protein N4A71_22065 [Carboxylicivirga sp.]|jgi:hypothetical protein|nr:hypothetical protein [Carboxylicivirga sp.]